MHTIDLWSPAQDFLESLSEKQRTQLARKILTLTEDPFPAQSKQLQGFAPLRRIRSGDYRIVYLVEGYTVRIPLIDKRGDDRVYRILQNKFK